MALYAKIGLFSGGEKWQGQDVDGVYYVWCFIYVMICVVWDWVMWEYALGCCRAGRMGIDWSSHAFSVFLASRILYLELITITIIE